MVLISGPRFSGVSSSLEGDAIAVFNALLFSPILDLLQKVRVRKGYEPQLVSTWIFLGAAIRTLLILPAAGFPLFPPSRCLRSTSSQQREDEVLGVRLVAGNCQSSRD
jgi:hypothetical protein